MLVVSNKCNFPTSLILIKTVSLYLLLKNLILNWVTWLQIHKKY